MILVLTRGEGGQNPNLSADVICTWPLLLLLLFRPFILFALRLSDMSDLGFLVQLRNFLSDGELSVV